MYSQISRRHFLKTAAAVGAVGGSLELSPGRAQAQAATCPNPTRLIVDRRIIEVNGKAASVFGIQQAEGTPGLVLDPGQRFNVELDNRLAEPTIIHWHGQTPPPDQDGVTDTGLAALIAAGGRQAYDFAPRSGTHWMHSHHGLQEQLLMAAPLVVRTAEDLRRDVQEVIVLLHDFTFRDPAELLAEITSRAESTRGGTAKPISPSGMLGGHGMAMPGGTTMDLNDVEYDAYLANDRTLKDPLVVRTERGGRVRLRLINGATSTAFWIELGALSGTVVAVDGDPVQPVTGKRFPMAQAQRLDIMIQLPSGDGAFPVLAQREGDRQRTGFILATRAGAVAKFGSLADVAAAPVDLSLERRFSAREPLASRSPDITHRIGLTGTMRPYVWSIDDRTWADHRPLPVTKGQRVVLQMVNRSPMAHPMHLHGHHFQVVGLNGQPLHGAMRDTVLVPARGTVVVAFDADNPGRWLLHCHNLFHMATGMMTEVAYDHAA